MSDLGLTDTSASQIADLPRNMSYPWPQSYQPNVVVGRSLGGYARASRRGPSLLVNKLTFKLIGSTQAAQLLNVLRDYAGGAKALQLLVAGAFIKLADGSSLANGSVIASGYFQCRLYDAPEVSQVAFRIYEVSFTLTEDLY